MEHEAGQCTGAKGAAMIVAADAGERIATFPQPMAPIEGGAAKKEHRIKMEFGEVKLFVRVR